MYRYLGIAAGAAAGALLIRERQRRLAAERLAAAVLETLLRAIDANDPETGAHVRRVARYALILADAADLDERAIRNVERIALFHDVGKIDEALFDIIHDDSNLTQAEREAVRTHPDRGANVLAPLAAFYPDLSSGILAHHERWDGTGYPRGLRGAAIPLSARIVSIADAFDAITYGRRYRSAQGADDAAKKLMNGRGTQFDPDLVDLFLSPPVFDQAMAVLREDNGPRTRRAPRSARQAEHSVPKLKFRWRTTTPSPRVLDRGRQRSP
ncbi:MAG TPA: HD domain-containing phosphohydrolase [Gemmatimonadaceae bacterium]|nr:HD domain-containing phosphohydrolase [Gemmatimonadaceae bacterium]